MRLPICFALAGRPAIHTETLLAVCAAFVLLAGNGPFWRGNASSDLKASRKP